PSRDEKEKKETIAKSHCGDFGLRTDSSWSSSPSWDGRLTEPVTGMPLALWLLWPRASTGSACRVINSDKRKNNEHPGCIEQIFCSAT
ncbi:hypothetical protein NPIL_120411, partial [Nephila pilipes]